MSLLDQSLSRRKFGLAAAATLAAPSLALAQDWRARNRELVFAIVPAENAAGVTERFTPWVEYLSRELGVRVTLRIASDYAAVIEGQRAGQIHIASYGPSSYVRAHSVTNGGVEAFATLRGSDGSTGYFSVAYARANDRGARIEDFQGRNLCLVDVNSTSGFNVPHFAMSRANIRPDTFFANVQTTGSHENSIIALQRGTCDLAFNWWNSETDSNLSRMARRGMVNAADFKIVFRSDRIPGSPDAFLTSLPPEARAAIRTAYFEAPTRNRAAFDRLSDGQSPGFAPVSHADYQVIIELQQFVDRLRRERAQRAS
ncbi:MAG: phosphonate ABC transporter substrate-binding protein [Pseudomonadota bacterium]|jgi:phosphonate transport system substrate-binding protein